MRWRSRRVLPCGSKQAKLTSKYRSICFLGRHNLAIARYRGLGMRATMVSPQVEQRTGDKHGMSLATYLTHLTPRSAGARRVGSVALRAEGRRHRRAGDQRWGAMLPAQMLAANADPAVRAAWLDDTSCRRKCSIGR